MARNQPRTRLTDRKRAAILEAAVAEFRAHGFDNTSMDAIAAAAEVSKRTVYNHFPSKEGLFAAIVDELMSRSDAVPEYQYDSVDTLEHQLIEIGRSVVTLLASDDFQNLARVIMSRFLQSPQLTRTMTSESRHPETGIANWIREAKADGRLDVQDSKQAARQFMGLLNAFAFWPQLIGREPPLSEREQDKIVKSAVAMFLTRYAT
jgi:TetR/AcrR family transcriptional regulator of autoinduction and epiphytic fitness